MDKIKSIDTEGKPLPRLDKFEYTDKFEIEPISLFRLTICDSPEVLVFAKINGFPVAMQVASQDILNYLWSLLPEKPNDNAK